MYALKVEPIATEGRSDFFSYGIIAKKIMQKMGYLGKSFWMKKWEGN